MQGDAGEGTGLGAAAITSGETSPQQVRARRLWELLRAASGTQAAHLATLQRLPFDAAAALSSRNFT